MLIQAIDADPNIPEKDLLIGPNLSGTWTPQQIWDTGFATDFNQNLAALAVERYFNGHSFHSFKVTNSTKGIRLTIAMPNLVSVPRELAKRCCPIT